MKLKLNTDNPFDESGALEDEAPRAVYTPPWSLVIDSREQAPFRFTRIPATAKEGGGYVVPRLTTGIALPTGDYSIAGLESAVCIERKSLSDLFGSVGRERDRFEREFQRMAEMQWSAIVVESHESDIELRPPRGTKILPSTILGTIESWSIRYSRTHWFFPGDRRRAEIRTYRLLARFWESVSRDKESA